MKRAKRAIRRIIVRLFGRDFSKVSSELLCQEIVSFDIFDTLIYRKDIYPEKVFEHINDESFKRKRINAERCAKRNIRGRELTLEDIYSYLPEYDKEIEVKKELEECYPNPHALKLFSKLKRNEKRIILISDMYMPLNVIRNILIKCGYDISGVNIYVSSECGFSKRTGKLFIKALHEEHVDSFFHIGDDFVSDCLMPSLYGIKTFLYFDRKTNAHNNI